MIIRQILAGMILSVFALSTLAQDVAGKWAGSPVGFPPDLQFIFDFVVVGDDLIGATSTEPSPPQAPPEMPFSGMVVENEVQFTAMLPGTVDGPNVTFTGAVEGDALTLTGIVQNPPPGQSPPPLIVTLARTEPARSIQISAGETHLCVGEYGAFVADRDGSVIGAERFRNNERWLVDERGLRPFGSEAIRLNECVINNGRPIRCEQSGGLWGGRFSLGRDDVFTLILMSATADSTTRDSILKGKCRVIDE
jgi:hypothetical protein